MTDFVRKRKGLTIISAVALIVILILVFAGCSIGNAAIEQISQFKSRDKAICTINPQNATQIVYEGKTYQILNQTVKNSQISGWNGVFRKVAVLDDRFCVIKEIKSDVDSTTQVNELKKHLPQGAKYVVTFFNVFTIKGVHAKEAIAVNLNTGTYKAVPVGTELADEKPIQFKEAG